MILEERGTCGRGGEKVYRREGEGGKVCRREGEEVVEE